MPRSIRRLDLHIESPQIDLPADAPKGCPHVVISSELGEEDNHVDWDIPGGLPCVDTAATVLYIFNPEALANLLDLKEKKFHFGFINSSNFETYITRDKKKVIVGSLEIGTPHPDFEVTYNIQKNGTWKIAGGREATGPHPAYWATFNAKDERSAEYDLMLSDSMRVNEVWRRGEMQHFRYEVGGISMLKEQPKVQKCRVTLQRDREAAKEKSKKTGAEAGSSSKRKLDEIRSSEDSDSEPEAKRLDLEKDFENVDGSEA